jgi:hypothetical protein
MSDVIQTSATATLEVQALEEDGVTPLDLSTITPGADNLKIVCNGPKGAVVLFTGVTAAPVVFATDGSDGIFRVVVDPTDLTVEGPWQYQGYAKKPTGEEYRSPKFNFEAEDNLPES